MHEISAAKNRRAEFTAQPFHQILLSLKSHFQLFSFLYAFGYGQGRTCLLDELFQQQPAPTCLFILCLLGVGKGVLWSAYKY